MVPDRKYDRHCGQLKEFDIASDRKFFRVTFKSNDRLDGTGFNATYRFLDEIETYTAKSNPVNGTSTVKGTHSALAKLDNLNKIFSFRYFWIYNNNDTPTSTIFYLN